MKILVALVTENDFLRKEFVKLRSTIRLPANLSRLPMTLELDAPDLSRSPTLEPYFHTKATSCGAMVVLADRRCASSVVKTQPVDIFISTMMINTSSMGLNITLNLQQVSLTLRRASSTGHLGLVQKSMISIATSTSTEGLAKILLSKAVSMTATARQGY